jgi:hypothetical protein
VKTDNKFHRDGKGGYVGCFETTLDGKPAVVTFDLSTDPDGQSADGPPWSAWAEVESLAAGVIMREVPQQWRHWTKRELTEDLRLFAAAGFATHGNFVRCRYGEPAQADYSVALVNGSDGSFEVIEQFTAANDAAASAYAEQHYSEDEWFVLDSQGKNINGGDQS